ncbi:ANTAR domain-containing response regulator [Mesorhizobium sp. CO1-1-8]|uniref:ANTAR domain-containing response regulator n=1 Tax=Mesorhizobium sp. CO1-1-8 TaxID=2876631 RepID=UPI001CD166A2|nr:ANTAR domain-containing protein [Mesorhizobium sp. CO1-1-8]MBZ9772537.1 ANTAR domain-containing protein [Mesorhizobium sp. CO1-1-8]
MSVEFCPLIAGVAALDVAALNPETDIILVDGDLNGAIQNTSSATTALPVATIGLVGIEAPGRLRALLSCGATAFLRKPVHVSSVFTALFLGVNQFLQRGALVHQLDEHDRRRQRRRSVLKAILRVMKQNGIDDDAAYAHLRRKSMERRCSIEDYCEELISRPEAATAPEYQAASQVR